jgi:putative adenylate-forming enzyme
LRVGWHFARTRWGLRFRDRASLEAWQAARISSFLAKTLPRAPFYREWAGASLSQLPVVDKRVLMERFDELNTAGVRLDDALAVALEGERSRDFRRGLRGDIAVGMSSGTTGRPGVFLVSRAEREMWAGVMLARALSIELVKIIATRRAPLRVAFFLRADSQLYQSLSGNRIDFRFYDLGRGIEAHRVALEAQAPEVLVAPARTLRWLADSGMQVHPMRVISVAEVLEAGDGAAIEEAFGVPVAQLYQCTEGFLGYTCEHGTIHLNEEFVHVEPEWIDDERFVPVVTDFTRFTQLIVRYRLNDILRVRAQPCPCGRPGRAIDAIEGRSDEVLWLPGQDRSRLVPLFPDALRRAVLAALPMGRDYRIEQRLLEWRVSVDDADPGAHSILAAALVQHCAFAGACAPRVVPMEHAPDPMDRKRRRIRCIEPAQLEAA